MEPRTGLPEVVGDGGHPTLPGEEPGAFLFRTHGVFWLDVSRTSWRLQHPRTVGGTLHHLPVEPQLGQEPVGGLLSPTGKESRASASEGSRTGGLGVFFSSRIRFFLPHGKARGGICEGRGLVTAGAGHPSPRRWRHAMGRAGPCLASSGRGSSLPGVGRAASREPEP